MIYFEVIILITKFVPNSESEENKQILNDIIKFLAFDKYISI